MEKPWENNKGYEDFLTDVFDSFPEEMVDDGSISEIEIDDEEVWNYYNEGYSSEEVAEMLCEEY